MRNFQDLLNRFTKGEFNYEQMGNIPEVRKRTNTILNDPRQMLLNTDANYSNMGSYVPSQMPGAMGGGMGVGDATAVFDHGITGNLSDIQNRPFDYGMKGGLKQMPYMYGTQGPMLAQGQGGFNIMNPFTYGNMKKAVEGTRAGDENIEYSDTPTGKIGEVANERNRMIQQLLQGY